MGIRSLFGNLRGKIIGKNLKIVFPEGSDERVLRAATRLKFEGLIEPIILGEPQVIRETLDMIGFADLNYIIINPEEYDGFDEMKAAFLEIRKDKITPEEADELLHDVNYFGVMLVKMGLANGMVSGAMHSTAATVRPALQIIKTKPGVSRTSGVFLMSRETTEQRLVFADCAINVDPNAQQLAEIAVNTADTAKIFNLDPKVAMLSFSTKGSAKAPKWKKFKKLYNWLRKHDLTLLLTGNYNLTRLLCLELQLLKRQAVTLQDKQMSLSFQTFNQEILVTRLPNVWECLRLSGQFSKVLTNLLMIYLVAQVPKISTN